MDVTYTLGVASNVDTFTAGAPADGKAGKLWFYFLYVTYVKMSGDPTFAFSCADATQVRTIAPKGALKNKLTAEERAWAQKGDGQPTYARAFRVEPLPGGVVRVEITVPGAAPSVQDFSIGAAVNAGTQKLGLRKAQAPRLVIALNTTYVEPAKPLASAGAPTADDIKAILTHIHKRLVDGPSAVWTGVDGTPDILLGQWNPNNAEEKWARAYDEMMTSTPYGLPLTHYSGTGITFDDHRFYLKFVDEQDPGYAIVAECQHLVTLGYLTRGIRPPGYQPGGKLPMFTAGDGSATTVAQLGGTYIKAAEKNASLGTGIRSIDQAIEKDVTPGSSWVYNGAWPVDSKIYLGNKGAAHIGFVLRVDKDARRVQAFDTGGLNVPNHAVLNAKNINDDEWTVGTNNIPGPARTLYMGVCILPKVSEGDLEKAVVHLKKARPLGFARLALVSRAAFEKGFTAADVYWMSPLLRMHFDGAGEPKNFPYTAYLWSLRDHPGASQIVAVWSFTTPQGLLAQALLDGGRGSTIEQLVAAAKKLPKAPANVMTLSSILDVNSKKEGTVDVWHRYDQHAGETPFNPSAPLLAKKLEAWGSVAGVSVDDLPYFTSK